MSQVDPLRDLQLGVQALRRLAERLEVLGGATGVRALPLPHQLWNVRRVLTATRVRHLLADEVGLGKTIQVMMIVNALGLQRQERHDSEGLLPPHAVAESGLRVLIVVPDSLLAQWRDELLSRGHQAASGGNTGDEQALPPGVTLAWPRTLKTGDIDPSAYDLLVVDEFHALTKKIQSEILSSAADFSHLLLVTATPPLHDPDRLLELIEMLEPERVRTARLRDPECSSSELIRSVLRLEEDVDAVRELAAQLAGRSFEPTPGGLAEALCVVRGFVRMRRDEWRSLFAAREHRSIIVEPNEAEVQRQALMWRYFGHLGDLSRQFDLDLLAQRVIRSPASLRQRVTFLRGHGHEREGLLEKVAEWLPREHGETRFDALCDLLSEIWLEQPDAKVLLAAGDNLTVDDLADRLPSVLDLVGPPGRETTIRPVRIRNQPKGKEEIAKSDEIDDAVRKFVLGDANLLLAAEVGQVGLNLQVTRDIILYSVPWSPQEVEQWVGRVDRIGNDVVADQGTIRVYTIAQRGLVDERVLGVLEAASVLERSLSLDPAAVDLVSAHIREAALGNDPAAWRAVLAEAARLGEPQDLDAVGSRWVQDLPWDADGARGYFTSLESRPPQGPSLVPDGLVGLSARERGVRLWLDAFRAARQYDIRKMDHRSQVGGADLEGVRTLGYIADSTPARLRMKTSSAFGKSQHISETTSVALGEDLIPEGRKPAWFLCRRRHLQQPPRREVVTRDGPKPLYFLDHGSPLHERLVSLWMAHGQSGPGIIDVRLPREHAASALRGSKVLVRVALADPALLLPDPHRVAMLQGAGSASLLGVSWKRGLKQSIDADRRFMREQLPSLMCVAGFAVDGAQPSPVPVDLLNELLKPPIDSDRSHQPTSSAAGKIELDDEDVDQLDRLCATQVSQIWSPHLDRVRQALDDRVAALAADLHVVLQGLDAEAEALRAEIAELTPELERLQREGVPVSGHRRKLRVATARLEEGIPEEIERLQAVARFHVRLLETARQELSEPNALPYRDVLVRISR